MFQYLRNAIFKSCGKYTLTHYEGKHLPVNCKHPEAISQRYRTYNDAESLAGASENLFRAMEKNLNEFELKEWRILRKYYDIGKNDPHVNPQHIREQLDAIQIIKNLRLIEANEQDYDPEHVEFERLRAKFLLGEEGAKEKFVEYVKQRPYLRKYEKWADETERVRAVTSFWYF